MTVQSLEGRLGLLLAGRTPLLLVVTESEDRVEAAIKACLHTLPAGTELWSWTVTDGLRSGQTVIQGTTAVTEALNAALKLDRPAVFFFKDLHLLLARAPDPWVIRRLKDLAAVFPARAKSLVFRSATVALPEDLVPTVSLVEDAPPHPGRAAGSPPGLARDGTKRPGVPDPGI